MFSQSKYVRTKQTNIQNFFNGKKICQNSTLSSKNLLHQNEPSALNSLYVPSLASEYPEPTYAPSLFDSFSSTLPIQHKRFRDTPSIPSRISPNNRLLNKRLRNVSSPSSPSSCSSSPSSVVVQNPLNRSPNNLENEQIQICLNISVESPSLSPLRAVVMHKLLKALRKCTNLPSNSRISIGIPDLAFVEELNSFAVAHENFFMFKTSFESDLGNPLEDSMSQNIFQSLKALIDASVHISFFDHPQPLSVIEMPQFESSQLCRPEFENTQSSPSHSCTLLPQFELSQSP